MNPAPCPYCGQLHPPGSTFCSQTGRPLAPAPPPYAVEDALLLFLLPVPTVGTVLLYLDIRRQAEGFDDRGVRAGIEALRGA